MATRRGKPSRDRANTALEARVRKLEHELAFARNPVVRFTVGRDRRILEADEAFTLLTGRRVKKRKQLRLDDVLSPYQRKLDVVFDHFLKGVPYPGPAKPFLTMEIRGTGRFFEFSFQPQRDRRGTIRRFRVSGHEVTTELLRKRVEQYHRTGEAIHRTIDRVHLGCLHAYNTRGRRFTRSTFIGGVTNKLAQSLGFTVTDVPGQDYKAKPQLYRHPVVRLLAPETIRALDRCLAKGTEDWVEGKILAEDGARRPARFSIIRNLGVWGNTVFTVLILDRSEEENTIRQLSSRVSDSEQRYHNLFENAAYAIFLEDFDGNILDCNRPACEVYGYTRDEMLRLNVTDLIPPESVAELERLRRQLLRRGRILTEARNRTRDGTVIDVEVGLSLIELAGRKLVHVVCRDITARRQLERALQSSEARYRSLFESASDAIFLLDPDLVIVDCNRRACEQYGYRRHDLVGQDVRVVTTEETGARLPALAREVLRKGSAVFNAAGRTPDGTISETEVSATTVEVGGRTCLLIVCRDLTERREAERALRESEQRYRSLFDTVPVGLFRSTPDGRLLDVNAALVQMSGCPDRESMLKAGAEPFYSSIEDRSAWRATVERDGVVRDFEMRLRRRDGSAFWVLYSGRAIRDAEGRVTCYEGVVQEISERKAVEDALRASEASYRAVVEDQTELICRFRPDGTLTFVNDAYCRYFGRKRSSLIGRRFFPLIPEEDREKVADLIASLTPKKPVGVVEHRVQAPGQGLRWQHWTNRAAYDQEGAVVEFQAVGRDITERREAEQALKESEAKYRELVEQSLQGLAVAQGRPPRLVFVNKAFADMLGYTVDELCSLPPDEVQALVHEDDREVFFSRYLARAAGKRAVPRYEFRAVRRDGGVRWLEISAARIEYGGEPAVQATFVDVTERSELDRRIRDSEVRYRNLVEKMREVIYTLDTEGRVTSVNEAVTQVLGYTPEEMVGRHFVEWIPRAYQADATAAFQSILAGKDVTAETVLVDKRGKCHDIEFSSSPIVTEQGVTGTRGLVRDITERKRLEQEIRQSEEKYRVLIENLNAGLIIVQDGVIRLVNRAYEEISGFKSAELCGRPFDEFISDADRQRVRSRYLAREAGKPTPGHAEVRCRHADGRELTIEASSSLVQYEGRTATQTIVRDVTEQKLLQRQLQRAARLASVGTLAAGVAHEVNNPLAVISVDLLRLKRQYEADPFVAKLSAKLLRMTRRIAHITGGLLTFSKATGGMFGKHALHGALNVALDLMQSRFDYENKVLIRDYPPQLPTVWCDSDQLQQVFVNICINALEAMPRGATLTVSTDTNRRDKTVTVHFADTGTGMPAEAIERAFDPFYTTKESGTGLGLAVSHTIIDDHGGRIGISSEPGQGTTVSVVLPISKPPLGPDQGGTP